MNEADTGRAITAYLAAHPSLPRSDICYTTKLRDNNTSRAVVRASITKSLKASGLDAIDLFLLHSPIGGPEARRASWAAVEDAVLAGEVRLAGVSNFGVRHLDELMGWDDLRVKPVVNQIEVHPFSVQKDIRAACDRWGIVVQAYSPLVAGMRFGHPVLKEVAAKYGVSEAQVLVRWSVQHGFVTLPKSAKVERIVANADVGGFEISEGDMARLDGLDEKLVTDW